MLHRLCGPPSIPLSFILANVLPRWNTYCVCCGTEEQCSPTPSIHRLRRGLPGYLILFAPHAFEPQRQLPSSKPPSTLSLQKMQQFHPGVGRAPVSYFLNKDLEKQDKLPAVFSLFASYFFLNLRQ